MTFCLRNRLTFLIPIFPSTQIRFHDAHLPTRSQLSAISFKADHQLTPPCPNYQLKCCSHLHIYLSFSQALYPCCIHHPRHLPKQLYCDDHTFSHQGICSQSEPISSSSSSSILVEPGWLVENLDQVTILDVRGDVVKDNIQIIDGVEIVDVRYVARRDEFDSSHIPGAVFVDWTRTIVDQGDQEEEEEDLRGHLYQLASREKFASEMAECGVHNDIPVVIYDDGDMLFAARLWWAFQVYGHKDVRILNGGWTKWCQMNLSTSTDETCPLKRYGDYEPCHGKNHRHQYIYEYEQVLSNVLSDSDFCSCLVIDARSSAQYHGKQQRGPRAGRIPGSKNLPYRQLLDESGIGMAPMETLKKRLVDAGILVSADARENHPTIVYCNGGVASSLVIFSIALVLRGQMRDVFNYDGSWNEWSRRFELPIE